MNERMDEEIGALLDGRLESGPRTELLARLAASDEDFDVFADTAAVLREAEEGETAEDEPSPIPAAEPERPADVIPLRPRRASVWQRPAVRWLAAAAVLAALGLIPVLRSRTGGDEWRKPERVAALVSKHGTLPANWDHPWPRTRGTSTPASDSGVAARAGAHQVDLEVAARAKDFERAADAARPIAVLAEDLTGGGLVAQQYRMLENVADHRDPALQDSVAGAREELEALFGPEYTGDYLPLGAWTEAARLAAARQDAAFFRTPETRAAITAAERLGKLDAEAKVALDRLRSVVKQGQVRDWTSVVADLDTLQNALAR